MYRVYKPSPVGEGEPLQRWMRRTLANSALICDKLHKNAIAAVSITAAILILSYCFFFFVATNIPAPITTITAPMIIHTAGELDF